MGYAYIIELTFKVVMILASLGLVWNLIRKVFVRIKEVIKKYLFRFESVEQRLSELEKKVNRRVTKTSKKVNGKTGTGL